MKGTINTEEYEKDFLIRFISKKAEDKIAKLEIQLNNYKENGGKQEKCSEIEEKIAKIRIDLEVNLKSLRKIVEMESRGGPRIVIKTDMTMKISDDNDDKKYEKNLNKSIKTYCDNYKILQNEFWGHLKSNVNNQQGIKIFAPINTKLFGFQREGVSWMYEIYKKEVGGILADEMGLGKTLQVVAFLSALILQGNIHRALILCPTTIIDHWSNEWKSNYPFVRILIYHRQRTNDIDNFYHKCQSGVCLMSYESFKMYFDNCSKVKWDYIVLDEGHKIKNRKSHISGFVKRIPTHNRLLITGTPMQNNLAELWNILSFVNPKLLGDYEVFREHFEEPIKKGGYVNATREDVNISEELAIHLNKLITPFILRRTKKEVANQLPNKIERVVFCELTDLQSRLYEETINSESVFSILQGKRNVLCGIDMLRKICNHPYLLTRNNEMLSATKLEKCCGKMIMLNELLLKWNYESKKVLIFTQTIEMSNILAKNLDFRQYKYIRMDGKTPLSTRTEFVARFNTDPTVFVFLLTTRVGGLGLNLVGASRVVIYDPDWNPAIDIQAKERVYRYGQTDDVEIYKFITHDSVEEKILNTQIFKTILEKKIFSNAQLSNFINKLDLDIIFSYRRNSKKGSYIQDLVMDKEFSVSTKLSTDNPVTAQEMIDYIIQRETSFK